MNAIFKPLLVEDLESVKSIYQYYIEQTTVTFHTESITLEELQEFIYIAHPRYLSFGVYIDNEMIGYTYIAPYKKRQAYDRTGEITFYLNPDYTGKQIGSQMINFLEGEAKKVGFMTLLAVITANNEISINFFSQKNYTKCAHFKNVGEKFNQLLDVVIYQKEF